jgi:hypothetical protein
MEWSPTTREVVLDDAVADFIARSRGANPQFDRQWRGAEWRLSHEPDTGTPRFFDDPTSHRVLVIPQKDVSRLPALWIMYSYDANQVTVHVVRFGEWTE